MSKKQSSKDIMLAHSKAKVNFYQSYLERYLSIMSVTQFFDTINIFDVFCGRGEYDDGGLGSPIRAVETIIKIKKEKNSDLKVNLFLNDAQKKYVERVKAYIEDHFPDYKKFVFLITKQRNYLERYVSMWLTRRKTNGTSSLLIHTDTKISAVVY